MPKIEDEKAFAALVMWLMGMPERRIASKLMMRRGTIMKIVQQGYPDGADIVTRQRALDELRRVRVGDDGSLRDGGRLPNGEWLVRLRTKS